MLKLLITVLVFISTQALFSNYAHAARCKDYSSCTQAVKNWCAGNHPRADGDGDGIPCENVCPTRQKVKEIMAQIGCSR